MVRQNNITEKIHSLVMGTDTDFCRVQCELKMFVEERINRGQELFKIPPCLCYDEKIIGVACVIFNFQVMLNKLVKLIQVDIAENFRGKISDGNSSPKKTPPTEFVR